MRVPRSGLAVADPAVSKAEAKRDFGEYAELTLPRQESEAITLFYYPLTLFCVRLTKLSLYW